MSHEGCYAIETSLRALIADLQAALAAKEQENAAAERVAARNAEIVADLLEAQKVSDKVHTDLLDAAEARAEGLATALDTIIESVDLHNAETNGTDVCNCELPDMLAAIARAALDANRTQAPGSVE